MSDVPPTSRTQTFSQRARELSQAIPEAELTPAGELPELALPTLPPELRTPLAVPRSNAHIAPLEAPVPLARERNRFQRLYDAAHARLREAAHDAVLDDLELSIGVGEIELEILEGRQLTGTQRTVLRDDPRLAFARTRLTLDLDLLPRLELQGVRWTPDAPMTVTIDTPIEIVENGPEGRPRAVLWEDVLQVLKGRTLEAIRDGVPRLDGSTLGGEPWPPGGRVELRGAFRQRLDGRLEELTGNAERTDEIYITAERINDTRVDLHLGRLDDTRLRPRLNLEELRFHGDTHFRELSQSYYPLNPNDELHREAFRALLDFRSVLGVEALPTISTEALDGLGLGHARYDFSRTLDPSPHVRIPLTHFTVGGGVRRYDQVGGWVQHPRRLAEEALDADGMEARIEELLDGDRSTLESAPAGTRMVTHQRTRFDWNALVSAHTTESILNGYLSLGVSTQVTRDSLSEGFVQRDARWVPGPDGHPRVVLAYRAYDREQLRMRLRASAGLRVGPELRRMIREFGDETLSLEENAAELLGGIWSGGEDFADEYFDRRGGEVYRAVEREVNDLLEQLALTATSDSLDTLFHQTRLRSEPLDLRDPSDRAFFHLAMSDHPVDAVIAEGARLDLFTEQRFDEDVSWKIERSFQALALRIAVEREEWIREQNLVFKDSHGNTIVATGWDVGDAFERDGLFEDLKFRARAIALYDRTNARTRNSGLVARFELDDWSVLGDEARPLQALVPLLDLSVHTLEPGDPRGPLRLDVLFGPMFGSGEGEAAMQISQRGLREAIIKGPLVASTFRNVVLEMRGESVPPYLRPSRGPLAAAFDPSTLRLAASGDVATFRDYFPHLDIHYIRALLTHSGYRPSRADAQRVLRDLLAHHPEIDPDDPSTIDAVREDLRATRMGHIIIEYWANLGDSGYAKEERRDLEIEWLNLGGRRLGRMQEVEARAAAFFQLALDPIFVNARAQLLADAQAEPTLEQVEALMEEGFLAVAQLGRPSWTHLGNQDFFALAHWTAIARAAGTQNVVARVDFETEDGLRIRAGDRVLDDPNIDRLMDELAAQVRRESAQRNATSSGPK